MSALFDYTSAQHYNIARKLHPDCCQAKVCNFCGASEERGACGGELTGLALELFEEASCSARNANVKSIGQFTNWKVHDRHARAFDAAARFVAKSFNPSSLHSPGADGYPVAIEARDGEGSAPHALPGVV